MCKPQNSQFSVKHWSKLKILPNMFQISNKVLACKNISRPYEQFLRFQNGAFKIFFYNFLSGKQPCKCSLTAYSSTVLSDHCNPLACKEATYLNENCTHFEPFQLPVYK